MMRKIVFIVATLATGCAGTSTAQRQGKPIGSDTPVVIKQPSISEKIKYTKQQEQKAMAKSEVTGNVIR